MTRYILHLLECVLLTAIGALSSGAQIVTIQTPQFRSVYNLETLCPQQVTWTIRQSDIGQSTREPSWKFVNTLLRPQDVISHADFNKSGYDRGHMCPAADRSSDRRDMRATFELANVAAQAPRLNRGVWKKTENFCRNAAYQYGDVEVISMPVFINRDTVRIGGHRVAVPHAFFKAAWLPATDSIIGVWFFFNK